MSALIPVASAPLHTQHYEHHLSLEGRVFDVRNYGTVGDGTTNDTSAIQAAIDAAHTAGGGTVYFPTGTYLISLGPSGGATGGITVTSNVTLQGSPGATLTCVTDTATTPQVGIGIGTSTTPATYVQIRDLHIDGLLSISTQDEWATCIYLYNNATDVRISGCEVENWMGDVVACGTDPQRTGTGVTRVTVDNNHFHDDVGQAVIAAGSDHTTGPSKWLICDNYFHDSTGGAECVWLEATNCTVRNNVVDNYGPVLVRPSSPYCSVTDNLLYAGVVPGPATSHVAMLATAASYTTFARNLVDSSDNAWQWPISIGEGVSDTLDGILIESNELIRYDGATSGIIALTPLSAWRVINNHFSQASSANPAVDQADLNTAHLTSTIAVGAVISGNVFDSAGPSINIWRSTDLIISDNVVNYGSVALYNPVRAIVTGNRVSATSANASWAAATALTLLGGSQCVVANNELKVGSQSGPTATVELYGDGTVGGAIDNLVANNVLYSDKTNHAGDYVAGDDRNIFGPNILKGSASTPYVLTGTSSKQLFFNQSNGTAAPTSGTWARGDIMWNTTPSSGGPPGWVCTTAGSPGTWKAMANLA